MPNQRVEKDAADRASHPSRWASSLTQKPKGRGIAPMCWNGNESVNLERSTTVKIILIRHASRERNPDLGEDKDLPLTSDGKKEACELGDRLVSLGLKPTLYLTSRYTHAKQTGDLLQDQVGGNPLAALVAINTLTPHEEYTFERIILESEQNGHDLSKLEQVAFVLHHPRLNQLLARLTSQPESPGAPKFAGAVCLTADSLDDFIKGKGKQYCRI
jgi:phosphohistidine phosphatase SixA